MQRTATPCTPVRFRLQPPIPRGFNFQIVLSSKTAQALQVLLYQIGIGRFRLMELSTFMSPIFARVAKLVDARDLKSLEGNLVPVHIKSGPGHHLQKAVMVLEYKKDEYMEKRKELVSGRARKRSSLYPLLMGVFVVMILINAVMLTVNNI
jgi:hypothetical protein